jgi:hypothetical protein
MRDRDLISDKQADPRRFWCAYTDLEEYHAGMWKPVSSEDRQLSMIAKAVALLRSPERFCEALKRVLDEWPISCLAEFTSPGNHLAWMGQAACCLVDGVPESLTRRAWWKLAEKERETANQIARDAHLYWKNVCRKNYRDIGVITNSLKNTTRGCGNEFQTKKDEETCLRQLSLF